MLLTSINKSGIVSERRNVMEIKNPKYIEVMNKKCDYADRLIKKMLTSEYIKSKIYHRAYDQANVVYKSMGTLNVTRSQAYKLQRMANKRVDALRMQDIGEYLDEINGLYIVK